MNRDDEIYALAKADKAHFFPGGHSGRAAAFRAIIGRGCSAEWNERGDDVRSRGFVMVTDADDKVVATEKPASLARVVKVATASEAWELLIRDPAIDPVFLEGLRDRLVEVNDAHEIVALPAPRTFAAAIALAEAPREMRAAEEPVTEAFLRAAAFGVGACPPIFWRTIGRPALNIEGCSRAAFGPIDDVGIEVFGRNDWLDLARDAERTFSFSSRVIDIPGLLRWAAVDFTGATRFDAARATGRMTKALSGADFDNPYEPLLRIALFGLAVHVVTPERVVLACAES